jgi:hypothetical protein
VGQVKPSHENQPYDKVQSAQLSVPAALAYSCERWSYGLERRVLLRPEYPKI